MRHYAFLFFILNFYSLFSQEVPDFDAIDSLYREDQFYVGITYNTLNRKSSGVTQNSFSTGLAIGFLRDFPINKNRTIAIAPGFGFSYNNYKYNILVQRNVNFSSYSLIPVGSVYDKNKLALYYLEIPLELRWRTSTFTSHKFWRIYSGVKWSYLVLSQSRYSDSTQQIIVDNNSDLSKIQYGCYIAAGYNSLNLYVYYGINSLFKAGTINGAPLNLGTINIGLQFYIL